MYYLLYNINNKIFAFLLLSMEVLYCNSTQAQEYSIYTLERPTNWDLKRDGTSEFCSWCWCTETMYCVDMLMMVCVTFKW